MELGFLLDISFNSFASPFFPKVLKIIKVIYGSFVVNQQKTRVSIVVYNGGPSTVISLDQYQTIDRGIIY